jgi:hypothetical protein
MFPILFKSTLLLYMQFFCNFLISKKIPLLIIESIDAKSVVLMLKSLFAMEKIGPKITFFKVIVEEFIV